MTSQNNQIQTTEELSFAVFCIENLAKAAGIRPEEIYRLLTEKSDILKTYIVPEYEVLHTQSKEYIVSELLEVMRERGVA